jgi:hypothetical protein
VLVEAPDATAAQRAEAEDELRRRLGATIALTTVATGTLPVAEHKTRLVYRLLPGDELPLALAQALERKERAR